MKLERVLPTRNGHLLCLFKGVPRNKLAFHLGNWLYTGISLKARVSVSYYNGIKVFLAGFGL